MTKEQLALQILQEYAHEAAETLIADGFKIWHSRYYGYCWYPNDDAFEEAIKTASRSVLGERGH